MDPNNTTPYQQPQDPSAQPIGQPLQPQAVVGGNPPTQPMPPSPQPQQPQMANNPYGPQQPIQPQYPQSQPAPSYGPPQAGNKRMMIGIIVGVVAILVVGGIAFALLSKKNPSTSTTASSSSNSTSSSAATTTKSACELFTLSDAQAILGSSATAGASGGPTNAGSVSQSICNYNGSGNIAGINIIFDVSSKSAGATAGFEAAQSAASGSTPVSGVGDKAFYGSDINTLAVLKGNVFFTVLVSSQDGSSTQSQATQVAQKILSNL